MPEPGIAWLFLGLFIGHLIGVQHQYWISRTPDDEDEELDLCEGDCGCHGLACECYCAHCRAHYGEELL